MMHGIFRKVAALAMGALVFAAGCDDSSGLGPDTRFDPRSLEGNYHWVSQGWEAGAPVGYPAIELTWFLPVDYSNEPFRVYARLSNSGSYGLIATVTSCSMGVCRYTDTNVTHGRSYDYFVVSLDERNGVELGASMAIAVTVPTRPNLAVPTVPSATALDGAAFLRWGSTGAERYLIVTQLENDDAFLIGETDGTSFYDDRAENGNSYVYFIAGVDSQGHVSALSQGAQAIPRPDFHADIVYAHQDSPEVSGFRFVDDETQDPILPGSSPNAQWRLEWLNGALHIVPLGQTVITSGAFTTELTCGPGSDASCVDISVAPAASEFGSNSVLASAGLTYVLRVMGPGNRAHYAKLRVQGATNDVEGRRLIVFDWAYQLRPDEPRLQVIR